MFGPKIEIVTNLIAKYLLSSFFRRGNLG